MEILEKARLALRKHILENKEQVKKDLEEMRELSKPPIKAGKVSILKGGQPFVREDITGLLYRIGNNEYSLNENQRVEFETVQEEVQNKSSDGEYLRSFIIEEVAYVKLTKYNIKDYTRFFKKLYRFIPFKLEYNCYNGFMIGIFEIEWGNLESSLFHVGLSKDYIYLQLLFINFEIWERYE